MKDKLLEIARNSGIVDSKALEEYFSRHSDEAGRVDLGLLEFGVFTEEQVLMLFGRLFDGVQLMDATPDFLQLVGRGEAAGGQ